MACELEDFRTRQRPRALEAAGRSLETAPFRARPAAPGEISVTLPIEPPVEPMLALSVGEIPVGPEWQYEPKWDGFRCLAFRDGERVFLQSKSGQPFARYFPEIVEAVAAVPAARFVLDGEIVVPGGRASSPSTIFCSASIPAESRVRKLAAERPALYVVFDLLVDEKGRSLLARPLSERRTRLEEFARKRLAGIGGIRLSPVASRPRGRLAAGCALRAGRSTASSPSGATSSTAPATGPGCRRSSSCEPRTASSAVFAMRPRARGSSARCFSGSTTTTGSSTTSASARVSRPRRAAGSTPRLEKLIRPPGFTGRAPGGPSRWSTRAHRRLGAARAGARRRSAVRPLQPGPFPARHEIPALAPGQGAGAVHDEPGRAGKPGVGEPPSRIVDAAASPRRRHVS